MSSISSGAVLSAPEGSSGYRVCRVKSWFVLKVPGIMNAMVAPGNIVLVSEISKSWSGQHAILDVILSNGQSGQVQFVNSKVFYVDEYFEEIRS